MGGLQDVLNQCDVVEAALDLARMARDQGLQVYLAEPEVSVGSTPGYVRFDAVLGSRNARVMRIEVAHELLIEDPEQALYSVLDGIRHGMTLPR